MPLHHDESVEPIAMRNPGDRIESRCEIVDRQVARALHRRGYFRVTLAGGDVRRVEVADGLDEGRDAILRCHALPSLAEQGASLSLRLARPDDRDDPPGERMARQHSGRHRGTRCVVSVK